MRGAEWSAKSTETLTRRGVYWRNLSEFLVYDSIISEHLEHLVRVCWYGRYEIQGKCSWNSLWRLDVEGSKIIGKGSANVAPSADHLGVELARAWIWMAHVISHCEVGTLGRSP